MRASGTKLYCIGVSYKTAPQSFREQLHLDAEVLANCMRGFATAAKMAEFFVLSTCNRVELYWIGQEDGIFNYYSAHVLFCELVQLSSGKSIDIEVLKNHSYFFQQQGTVAHLFRVVSSLDSMVVGETQITGQFKDSIAIAFSAKTLGPVLDRLANEALTLAKKIRTQTGIGRKTVSISHAAIDLAKRVFRDIGEHHFLFIGAGQMSRLAASYALNYKPKEIWICNRSLPKANDLVDELGMGQAHTLCALYDLLEQAEIVVCATNAGGILIEAPKLAEIMIKRRKRPLFLVDISIPRNIDPGCAEIDNVYLFEVDSLKEIVDENMEERKAAAEKAQDLIERQEQRFASWLSTLELKPAIVGFRNYVDELLAREMAKSFGGSTSAGLSPEQRLALNSFVASVGAKMVADVATTLQNAAQVQHREQLAQAVRLLFPAQQAEDEGVAGAWLAPIFEGKSSSEKISSRQN